MLAVERLRGAILAAAFLFAAGAAWLGGSALFGRPAADPASQAALRREFPPAPPAPSSVRSDRTLESFRAVWERTLVAAPPVEAIPVGPPPFKLLGTVYNAVAPQDSSAMVQDSSGAVRSWKVGETVKVDDAKLLGVLKARARFLWRGREVELGPEGPPVAAVSLPPGKAAPAQRDFTIAPEEWRELYGNAAAIYNQVRLEVNLVDGRKEGLRIIHMEDGFPGKRFGLQLGDIVHKVNGASVNDPLAAGATLLSLKEPQAVAMEIERGGKRYVLSVNVKEPSQPAPPPSPETTPAPEKR